MATSKQRMLYNDYLIKTSRRFSAVFGEISTKFNFDQGNEFEICLAHLLDQLLPDKYGVCRGNVVDPSGSLTGDDIIVYDKLSAPNLRPDSGLRFIRKEEIPVEAVYAYIEAKNSIELHKQSEGTYLGNAIQQVNRVKAIPREPRYLSEPIDGVQFSPALTVARSKNLPCFLNPLFTMIFARSVRISGKEVNDFHGIEKALADYGEWNNGPDILVLGHSLAHLPFNNTDASEPGQYRGPFCMTKENDSFTLCYMPDYAYGFGIASLIYALENIRLGQVDWQGVLFEGVNSSKRPPRQ